MTITDTSQEISHFLHQYIQSSHTPGVALAVMKGGEILYSGADGFSSIENQTPMTISTLFGAGSITKSVTALVFLLLEHEGFLNLDDPIEKYFSKIDEGVTYLDGVDGDRKTPLQIKHLLSHSSGIPELGFVVSHFFRLCGVEQQGSYEVNDTKNLLSGIIEASRLRCQRPGSHFLYSNENYTLLARIAELATGETFPEVVRKWILTPLGMGRSSIGLAENVHSNPVITGYIPGADKPVPIPLNIPESGFGAGGLVTNIEDLCRYLAFLLGVGTLAGQRISAYSPMLWNKIISRDWAPGLHYGLGWFIQEDDPSETMIYHGGDILFSGGICALLPGSGSGFILGQNAAGSPALLEFARNVFQLLHQSGKIGDARSDPNEKVWVHPQDISGFYATTQDVYKLEAVLESGLLKIIAEMPGVGKMPALSFAVTKASEERIEFQPLDYPLPTRRGGCVIYRQKGTQQLWLEYENSLFRKIGG